MDISKDISSVLSPLGRGSFVGVATFCGLPVWKQNETADAVIMGIPYDEGATNKPGARFGPREIRSASAMYSYAHEQNGFFDADRRRRFLSGKTIRDAGDVLIQTLCREENYRAIQAAVSHVAATGAFPMSLGGDHSVTYPIVSALNRPDVHYLHLDAHIDCDRFPGSPFTHGSPVFHIIEENRAASIHYVGIRGLTNDGADMDWVQEKGAGLVTAREFKDLGAKAVVDALPEGDYYLSLDIDFFDPAQAPATGTPEPGGLFFRDFSDILAALGPNRRIIGADVVEVSSGAGPFWGPTALLAARCAIEILGAALDR